MSYPFRVTPRQYQIDQARFIQQRETVLLADEMGTGKSKIALDFIGAMLWRKKISRALIICKLRGIAVWEDELRQNMQPDVTYAVLRPGPMPANWRDSKVIIVNYDYARMQVEELLKLAPDVIVVDESHRIKNPHARQSNMCHRLSRASRYRICLSGTPIGNRPLDLWSQFRFLKPDLLDEKFKDFKSHYAVWGGFGGFEIRKYKDLKGLAKIIHPYVRTQKKDINVAKEFIEVPIDMPPESKKVYRDMEKDFVAYVSSETTISAPIVLAKLAKLSQISGGFIRDTETEQDFSLHTAKLEALKEYTDSLLEQDEKRVVIFARYLWELAKIKELLALDWVTYTIKGGVTIKEQKLAESLFKESGGAMLCQIASGSESINLQSSRYVIFYSFDYSQINFQQAQDRVHRMGQKASTCYYYVLMCRGTLDRRIYGILKQKKSIADEVMNLVEDARKGRLSA